MSEVTLSASSGRETGTPSSRRLRREGAIPGVVYGMGSEPVSVQVERSEFRRAMTTEAGVNALIKLTIDDQAADHALVKEIQRHPVRREVIHIDFQRIDPLKPILLTVPLVLTGETKKVTSMGGVLEQRLRELKVTVRPDSIPTEIYVDTSKMVVDATLFVGDLELPDGVTTDVDPTLPVVAAKLTRAAIVALRQAAKGTEPETKGKKK
jgi:large subunit ribosomal protein L25